MKLPDSFLEELRARTPIAALVSRRVKLSRSGRHMKGCCPFHTEKTPSFYVYDDSYHCFGCGAHGDAIGFVMQTQGASFMEAVQSLASEAGMDVPKSSPTAEAAERQRLDLHAVMDAAAKYYETLLHGPNGAKALTYLRQRGLSDETIARFNLGWAGEGRGALAASLSPAGITQPQLLEAGLLRANEEGEIRGELFFNRVMFPIRDRTARMISFGGRILGDGQPKYVNGPETLLFSKRRSLYGLHLAREASRKGADVVAVEGYIDVIALHQAGFPGAVAPLGTALTPEQLEELWRLSPAPTLCFDGDAAGARAAARAAEAALPALAPDRTIRIATLPAGEDPDTLIRRRGADAFAATLRAARPLEESLFDLLRTSGGDQTPEQKAAFRTRLTAAAARIQDKTLAAEYRRALLDRFFAANRRPVRVGPMRTGDRASPTPPVRTGPRPNPHTDKANLLRALTLTAIVLEHPYLLHDIEEAFGSLALPAEMQRLRDAILAHAAQSEDEASLPLDSAGLINHLNALGLTAEVTLALEQTPSCARKTSQPAEAEAGWWHFYGLMHRDGLEDAVQAARRIYEQTGDEAAFARLNALCIARDRLRRGELSEDEEEGPETFAT
jgi:DNA primase